MCGSWGVGLQVLCSFLSSSSSKTQNNCLGALEALALNEDVRSDLLETVLAERMFYTVRTNRSMRCSSIRQMAGTIIKLLAGATWFLWGAQGSTLTRWLSTCNPCFFGPQNPLAACNRGCCNLSVLSLDWQDGDLEASCVLPAVLDWIPQEHYWAALPLTTREIGRFLFGVIQQTHRCRGMERLSPVW